MKTNEYLYDRTDESASHFCAVCGAWWLLSSDGTWQLRSRSAGERCCNNQPMHGNRNIVSARHAVMAASNIYSSPLKAALFQAQEAAKSLTLQCEELRTEADRAWKQLDAMTKDRDTHARWRQELADGLHECEKVRDALGVKLNALDRVRVAYETLRANAEEWECDGLGLWAQHGWWEAVDEELDNLETMIMAPAYNQTPALAHARQQPQRWKCPTHGDSCPGYAAPPAQPAERVLMVRAKNDFGTGYPGKWVETLPPASDSTGAYEYAWFQYVGPA